MFVTRSRRWGDVERFVARTFGLQVGVVLDPTRSRQSAVFRGVRALGGVDATPADTCGRSASDLADLMNEWAARSRQPSIDA